MRMTPQRADSSSVGTVSRRSLLGAAGAAALTAATASGASADPVQPGVKTIFVAGDSTAAPKSAIVKPEVGWGMALPYYLHPRVKVLNYALNGRSSKSFYDEGRLQQVLDRIGRRDALVIQFGHNDQKSQDPTLYTEPWTTYQQYLQIYIDGARARGATPVLVTSAERRRFDADGNAYSSHGEYPDAMRALAQREGVALVDVQQQSLALWQDLGPEETKHYFLYTDDGRRDNTHFQPNGGSAIARMVAVGLDEHGLLGTHRPRDLDRLVPESWFTWPEQIQP